VCVFVEPKDPVFAGVSFGGPTTGVSSPIETVLLNGRRARTQARAGDNHRLNFTACSFSSSSTSAAILL